jgi:hypothetical protein
MTVPSALAFLNDVAKLVAQLDFKPADPGDPLAIRSAGHAQATTATASGPRSATAHRR